MPASSAALMIASPSIISVFPASTDSAVAPARLHRLDRRHADDRHVEPHVLIRLRDLDDAHAGAGELPGARDHRVGALPSPRPRRPRRTSPRSSGRCRARRSRRRSGSRTRGRRCSSSVGARRGQHAARGPAAAPETPSNRAARCRSSRSTSATPEMIASVLRRFSRISTPSERQVRHDVGEQLRVLHLPGHHRLRSRRRLFSRLMHLPSWPSDTQCKSAAGGRAAASARSGNASSLMAMTVTSWPARARRVEDEKGKPAVAGDQAQAHRVIRTPRPRDPRTASSWPRDFVLNRRGTRLFVREHFFRPPRRAPQDDAALRRADEVDQVLDFGAGQRPILLDLLQRAASYSASTAAGSGTTASASR